MGGETSRSSSQVCGGLTAKQKRKYLAALEMFRLNSPIHGFLFFLQMFYSDSSLNLCETNEAMRKLPCDPHHSKGAKEAARRIRAHTVKILEPSAAPWEDEGGEVVKMLELSAAPLDDDEGGGVESGFNFKWKLGSITLN